MNIPVSYTHLDVYKRQVWDGFQSTLTQWICRYIQVYLWLPVSDMFSTILAKIQAVSYTHLDVYKRQTLPYAKAGRLPHGDSLQETFRTF